MTGACLHAILHYDKTQAKKRVKQEIKATGNVVNIAKAHLGMSVRTESTTNGSSTRLGSGDVADEAGSTRVRFEDDTAQGMQIKGKRDAVLKGGVSAAKAAAGVVAAGGLGMAAALVHKDNEHAHAAAAAAEREICAAAEARKEEEEACVQQCVEELMGDPEHLDHVAEGEHLDHVPNEPVPRDPHGRPRPMLEQVLTIARTSASIARTSATLARTSATLARSSIRSAVSGTSQSEGEGDARAKPPRQRSLGKLFRRGKS